MGVIIGVLFFSLFFLVFVIPTLNKEGLIEIVDDIRKNSFDPYSTMRSAYMQRRQALILNK